VLVATVAVPTPVAIVIPSIVIAIPPVVIAFPVPVIELATLITRCDPASVPIWRPRPVALAPHIMISDWMPVAGDPHIVRARTIRHHTYHSRWRWRSDVNADRDLRRCGHAAREQYGGKTERGYESLHDVLLSAQTWSKGRTNPPGRVLCGGTHCNHRASTPELDNMA